MPRPLLLSKKKSSEQAIQAPSTNDERNMVTDRICTGRCPIKSLKPHVLVAPKPLESNAGSDLASKRFVHGDSGESGDVEATSVSVSEMADSAETDKVEPE